MTVVVCQTQHNIKIVPVDDRKFACLTMYSFLACPLILIFLLFLFLSYIHGHNKDGGNNVPSGTLVSYSRHD